MATLESANQLLRTLTSNPKFSSGIDTTEMLQEVLDGIGFGGLWRSSTFHVVNENGHQCTVLTDRLIQVNIPKLKLYLIKLIYLSLLAYHSLIIRQHGELVLNAYSESKEKYDIYEIVFSALLKIKRFLLLIPI